MNEAMYPNYPVMLVDDEERTLQSYDMVLRAGGVNNTLCCQDSREVMPLLSDKEAEVVLLDLTMPYVSGEELLAMIVRDFPETPVIIITGTDDVGAAVKCMKAGAHDYMVKPVERNRLFTSVNRAIRLRELQRENNLLKQHILLSNLKHPESNTKAYSNNHTGFHS